MAAEEPWPPGSGGARTITDPAILRVLDLVAQRAHLAKIVAANKFVANTQTVYDANRELSVLTDVESAADLHKLPPGPLMLFVQAQMDYAKFVEVEWMAGWTEKSKVSSVEETEVQKEVDLLLKEGGGLDEVRKKIGEIGQKQYGALVDCREAVVGVVRERGREAFVLEGSELLAKRLKVFGGIAEGGIADSTGVHQRMIAAALGGLFSEFANGRPEERGQRIIGLTWFGLDAAHRGTA